MVPKTLEEHRDYLYEIVKLKLFFLHRHLAAHPLENYRDALRNRVDIYRKCDANPGRLNPVDLFFDAEPWLCLERASEAVYQRHLNDADAFEAEAFEVFRSSIDARCERDYRDDSVLARYQCGCFRHELELSEPERDTMVFHIANSKSPESIFDDPEYMKACFRQLLDVAEHEYGAKRIATGTWLNSVPKWLAFFPAEWMENLSAPYTDVQWHYGFWGQFITARGTFNAKYGEILRRTGHFPFYPKTSSCSIKAMRAMV